MQPDGKHFLFQPCAEAIRAGLLAHVLMQPMLHEFAFGVFKSALKIGQDSLEKGAGSHVALAVGAEHEDLLHFLGNVLVRRGVGDAEILAELPERAAVIDVHPLAVFAPSFDGAFFQRDTFVGNDHLRIEFRLRAQPMTGRTCSMRRIEENSRGSSSGNETSGCSGQANFSLSKPYRSTCCPAPRSKRSPAPATTSMRSRSNRQAANESPASARSDRQSPRCCA